MNEADTCRKYVVPKLQGAGWDSDPHSMTEQKSVTGGRIVVVGNKARRKKQQRADYLLRYTRDLPIAVVEAKASYKLPADGLQQAVPVPCFADQRRFAEMLHLRDETRVRHEASDAKCEELVPELFRLVFAATFGVGARPAGHAAG